MIHLVSKNSCIPYKLKSTICGCVARYEQGNMNQWSALNMLRTYQDQVTELLHLHTCLERKLKLTSFDNNIWEIKKMDFQRVYKGNT